VLLRFGCQVRWPRQQLPQVCAGGGGLLALTAAASSIPDIEGLVLQFHCQLE
jgi:hypothetical protein